MNLRYLCANHRQWLMADPVRADQHYVEWFEAGCIYQEQGLIDEAIPYLGCAFELADMLLSHPWPNRTTAVSRFTLSSIYLCRCYDSIGNPEIHEYLMDQARGRLQREQLTPTDLHITRCINSLQGLKTQSESMDACTSIELSNLLGSGVQVVH